MEALPDNLAPNKTPSTLDAFRSGELATAMALYLLGIPMENFH